MLEIAKYAARRFDLTLGCEIRDLWVGVFWDVEYIGKEKSRTDIGDGKERVEIVAHKHPVIYVACLTLVVRLRWCAGIIGAPIYAEVTKMIDGEPAAINETDTDAIANVVARGLGDRQA